ncbi:MAG: DMT family transporter [Oscillospiraceae bacterium]|nr:DMT family transporter [Oscillospiraceae bacterium]
MKNTIQHVFCPLLAAIIWGGAFSAQSICAEYVTPFWLNAIRSAIACVLLFIICAVRRLKIENWKDLILGGFCCGICLFLAGNAQQIGVAETSAGKAGFITTLYVVLVPIASILLGKKVGKRIWGAVAIAIIGLYFLCITEEFTIGRGDLFVLLCAVLFTGQIIVVDHFVQKHDGFALSCGMFFFASIFSCIAALCGEDLSQCSVQSCIGAILYVSVLSSCGGYTLQIISQKGGNPTLVSLLLGLESVFAMIAGAIILGERMTGRELFGSALMLSAVILAQLPGKKAKHTAEA